MKYVKAYTDGCIMWSWSMVSMWMYIDGFLLMDVTHVRGVRHMEDVA